MVPDDGSPGKATEPVKVEVEKHPDDGSPDMTELVGIEFGITALA